MAATRIMTRTSTLPHVPHVLGLALSLLVPSAAEEEHAQAGQDHHDRQRREHEGRDAHLGHVERVAGCVLAG